MRSSRWPLLWVSSLVGAACGPPTTRVTVELEAPTKEALDPFRATDRLRAVRVTIDGPDRLDDASVELTPSERTAVFEALPGEREVNVRVEGVDRLGAPIAVGAVDRLELTEAEHVVKVPVRRPLVYVIHAPACDGGCGQGGACIEATVGDGFSCQPIATGCAEACGEGEACGTRRGNPACVPTYPGGSAGPGIVYVLDLNTRELVERLAIPGNRPRALGITPRGGLGVTLTYRDGFEGYVAFLSASDHSFTTWKTERVHDLAFLRAEDDVGVAAGDGKVVIFDFAERRVLAEASSGGRFIDGALGIKAIFVVDQAPGVVMADLDDPTGPEPIFAPGDVASASGVTLSPTQRIAYVSSSAFQQLVGVDLLDGAIRDDSSIAYFSRPVRRVVYSEALNAAIGLEAGSNATPRVHAALIGGNVTDPVGLLPAPADLAVGPGGARIVAISAGTTTTSAGLTMIDVSPVEAKIEGSALSYPRDTEEFFLRRRPGDDEGFRVYQRFRPHRVAALYGQ